MPALAVYNLDGKEKEKIDLPAEIFGQEVNANVIYQAVVMYQAAQRQGTLKVKGRAEVSGGGKKPFRQKGTGRARAGSIRSPLWHGGGVIFGPQPRDFSFSIPKKIKIAALRETLNAKYNDQDIRCVTELKVAAPKTKEFVKLLANLKLKGKILALWDGQDEAVERASRNIPFVNLMRYQDVSAYDVIRSKKLLITKTAFLNLLNRIAAPSLHQRGTALAAAKSNNRKVSA